MITAFMIGPPDKFCKVGCGGSLSLQSDDDLGHEPIQRLRFYIDTRLFD